jgi:large subunit ribosomal protein L6
MSRIGKKIITIPAGVTVTRNGNLVTVKGPKGELTREVPSFVEFKLEDNQLELIADNNDKLQNTLHGTTRANVQNMITGVSAGFTKTLEIVGVGYRAEVKGKTLDLSLGYSHPVVFDIPEGLTVESIKGVTLKISGINKEQVGQFAAEVRHMREPEPYHGKGIHYSDETIRRKEGKTAKK